MPEELELELDELLLEELELLDELLDDELLELDGSGALVGSNSK